MPLDLSIAAGAASPIFKQIVDQVRLGVSSGRLGEGEALPSVRALAERLVINPNTVARAYAELAADGTILTQAGRGVFVGRRRQVYTKAERNRRLRGPLEAFVTEGLLLGFTADELTGLVAKKAGELVPAGEGK